MHLFYANKYKELLDIGLQNSPNQDKRYIEKGMFAGKKGLHFVNAYQNHTFKW